jgi:D-methionine transport system ATP-binding protein
MPELHMGTVSSIDGATPTPAKPLIRLEQVAKTFTLPGGGDVHAVRPLSLQIARGDVFGLVGKSGAGKSTLLRLINLLKRPDQGRVFVAGRELTALDKRALRSARQGIGMIFQQFNLLQNASVFYNVAFPPTSSTSIRSMKRTHDR